MPVRLYQLRRAGVGRGLRPVAVNRPDAPLQGAFVIPTDSSTRSQRLQGGFVRRCRLNHRFPTPCLHETSPAVLDTRPRQPETPAPAVILQTGHPTKGSIDRGLAMTLSGRARVVEPESPTTRNRSGQLRSQTPSAAPLSIPAGFTCSPRWLHVLVASTFPAPAGKASPVRLTTSVSPGNPRASGESLCVHQRAADPVRARSLLASLQHPAVKEPVPTLTGRKRIMPKP